MLLQMPSVFAKKNTDENAAEKLQYFGMIMSDMAAKNSKIPTRGEFAKYLLYYLGKDNIVPKASRVYFYDVPLNHEYAAYINYLLDLGYIKKDASGTFSPDEEINLKDAAMMILNVMGYGAFDGIGEADAGNAYSKVVKDAEQRNGKVTIGGVITMFANALDVPMFELSEIIGDGKVVFSKENTFAQGYFGIYKIKGRIIGTRLTGLEESIKLSDNEVAIGNEVFKLSDSMEYITEYLGYYVTAYCKENNENEKELLYFENNNTEEIVIKAADYISYSNNQIRYEAGDSGRLKTVSFQDGAYIIYNGQLMTTYTADIFDITNGSIELVGKGNSYDVVKIYDYDDIIIGGVSVSDNKIYSQYTKDIYFLDDYDNVIIRDRYGRKLSLEELKPNMVASVGKSGNIIIINISDKQMTGKLDAADYSNGTSSWTIDGIEYEFSGSFSYPAKPIGANVTVYLNYLDKISYIAAGKNISLLYGYLIKANIDDELEKAVVKIYTEDGKIEEFKTKDKTTVDGEKCNAEELIQKLKFEQPTSVKPSDTVQPQLIRYNINGDGEIVKIDTARVGDGENEETTLSKDIINEKREYLSEAKRLMGIGNDKSNFKLDCLVTDNTKVFVVPGNIDDAKIEYDSYSVASSAYFIHEKQYKIDAYDIDYTKGAEAGVVVVRLDSIIAPPENNPLSSILIVTGLNEAIDSDDNVVLQVEGYSYQDDKLITLSDYDRAKVFESMNVQPGDIIRYGYVNNKITGCDIDMKMSSQLIPGYSVAPKYAGNWHYDHIFAGYRIIVGNIIDINSGFMFMTDSATDKSTLKDCNLMYDLSNTRIFLFDKNSRKHLQKTDAATLKNYTYQNNKNAKAVVYSSFANAKMIIVYI